MATFRGSGSVANGAAFPTEAELQNAIDRAEAAATAAAASQALAAVNVIESETAETAAQAAQALAEAAVVAAQAEVVLAEAQVALATVQAGLADDARIAAEAEVVLAAAQVTLATLQAGLADAARILAETAETGATTQAAAASAFATTALGHANDADTARIASELALDTFDDRYLGSKASDPTLDNDGNALIEGALYWNSTTMVTRVYNGTAWVNLTDALSQTEADALYQPLDDELTDIALLAPTKGRLIAGNGSAWVDLGVGTNDQILTADSAETVGVKWAAPVIKTYHASQSVFTLSNVYEFTHGLGGVPDMVTVSIECIIAQHGFAVGEYAWEQSDYTYIGLDNGLKPWASATKVGVVSGDNPPIVYSKTTHARSQITLANWKFHVTAIKW